MSSSTLVTHKFDDNMYEKAYVLALKFPWTDPLGAFTSVTQWVFTRSKYSRYTHMLVLLKNKYSDNVLLIDNHLSPDIPTTVVLDNKYEVFRYIKTMYPTALELMIINTKPFAGSVSKMTTQHTTPKGVLAMLSTNIKRLHEVLCVCNVCRLIDHESIFPAVLLEVAFVHSLLMRGNND